MRVRKTTMRLVAVALGLLSLGAFTQSAGASTVRISSANLQYTGGSESNRVAINSDGAGGFTIFDSTARVTASGGCRSTGRNTAACTGRVTRVTLNVGSGN